MSSQICRSGEVESSGMFLIRLIVFCGILYFAEFSTELVFWGIILIYSVFCGKNEVAFCGISDVKFAFYGFSLLVLCRK